MGQGNARVTREEIQSSSQKGVVGKVVSLRGEGMRGGENLRLKAGHHQMEISEA